MILKPLAWQRIVWALLAAMTLFTLVILFFIIGFVISKGAHVITPEFLFGMPERMGKAGGIPPTIIASSSERVIPGTYGLTMMGASVWPMNTLAAADRVSAPLVRIANCIARANRRTTNCRTPK